MNTYTLAFNYKIFEQLIRNISRNRLHTEIHFANVYAQNPRDGEVVAFERNNSTN